MVMHVCRHTQRGCMYINACVYACRFADTTTSYFALTHAQTWTYTRTCKHTRTHATPTHPPTHTDTHLPSLLPRPTAYHSALTGQNDYVVAPTRDLDGVPQTEGAHIYPRLARCPGHVCALDLICHNVCVVSVVASECAQASKD
jgi:hypothetical protein